MTEEHAVALREQFALARKEGADAGPRLMALAKDAPILRGERPELFMVTPQRERAMEIAKAIAEHKMVDDKPVQTEVQASTELPGQWDVCVFVRESLDISILTWRMRDALIRR